MKEITGTQVRMARGALRWSIADLAKAAGVGVSTVQAIEAVDGVPEISGGIEQTLDHRSAARAASLEAIRRALTAAGVTFLPEDRQGAGIRLRARRAA